MYCDNVIHNDVTFQLLFLSQFKNSKHTGVAMPSSFRYHLVLITANKDNRAMCNALSTDIVVTIRLGS